jgi:hypothetical protein
MKLASCPPKRKGKHKTKRRKAINAPIRLKSITCMMHLMCETCFPLHAGDGFTLAQCFYGL